MKLIQDTIIIFQSQHTFCLKQFIPYICMGILIDTGSYSWYLLLKLPFKPFVCNYTTKCIQNTAQTKIRRLHSTVITWKIHSSATNHWQSNITVTVIPIENTFTILVSLFFDCRGGGLNDGDNGSPEIIKGTTLWSNIETFRELKNNHQGVTLG